QADLKQARDAVYEFLLPDRADRCGPPEMQHGERRRAGGNPRIPFGAGLDGAALVSVSLPHGEGARMAERLEAVASGASAPARKEMVDTETTGVRAEEDSEQWALQPNDEFDAVEHFLMAYVDSDKRELSSQRSGRGLPGALKQETQDASENDPGRSAEVSS